MLRKYMQGEYDNFGLYVTFEPYDGLYDECCKPVYCMAKIKSKLSEDDNPMIVFGFKRRNIDTSSYFVREIYDGSIITIGKLKLLIELFQCKEMLYLAKCYRITNELFDIDHIVVDEELHRIVLVIESKLEQNKK